MANSDGARFTVPRARALLTAALRALEDREREINDLNVYPVPDGDTGTNLVLTLRGVVEAVARLPQGLPSTELCRAVSQAALMGARGNSGVILSQVVRGAMEVVGQAGVITSDTLVGALLQATETAYRAVRRPVEGTMLTVLRDMAEAAAAEREAAEPGELMQRAIAAGWKSVERTPSLLKVLADAGVVDAGGYGLVVLVEGAVEGGGAWETPVATRLDRPPTEAALLAEDGGPERDSRYTYCTSFLVTGHDLDQDSLEEDLSALGDSVLVVGDGSRLKVHVHTDDPGRVLGLGTSVGMLTSIEIDNMKEQTAERRRRLADVGDFSPDDSALTQVVAVVAGEGNKVLFRNLGVDLLVDGGQFMNPSAEDLLRAVEKASAPVVVVLPNNGNAIMTADQMAKLADREVLVVPTRSIQAGLSAAVAYDRRSSGAENASEMRAALRGVVSAGVTHAVRDSSVDGVQIREQDFVGLVDDHVVVASPQLETVVEELVARLLAPERETLMALVGDDESGARAAQVVDRLRSRYPRVEFEVHEGGQPFYPLLLSAE